MPVSIWINAGLLVTLGFGACLLEGLGPRGRFSAFLVASVVCWLGIVAWIVFQRYGFGAGFALIALAKTTTLPFTERRNEAQARLAPRPPTRMEVQACWLIAGFILLFLTLGIRNAFHFRDFLANWPSHLDIDSKVNPGLANNVGIVGWIVFAPFWAAASGLNMRPWIITLLCAGLVGLAWILCLGFHLDFSRSL